MLQPNYKSTNRFAYRVKSIEVLESRVEVLESRVEVLESRVEVLESRVEVLESRVEVLESRVEVLESSFHVNRVRFWGTAYRAPTIYLVMWVQLTENCCKLSVILQFFEVLGFVPAPNLQLFTQEKLT